MIGIRAWGLAGHLGPTARTFVTAARAGQLAPRAPAGAARGSPLGAARSRWLQDALDPAGRAHHLALEALRPTLPRDLSAPVTLVLAWPDELGGRPTSDVPDHRLLRAILDALGAKLHPASALIRGGRTGFVRATETAIDLVEAGAAGTSARSRAPWNGSASLAPASRTIVSSTLAGSLELAAVVRNDARGGDAARRKSSAGRSPSSTAIIAGALMAAGGAGTAAAIARCAGASTVPSQAVHPGGAEGCARSASKSLGAAWREGDGS